jgi:hypothetical protein
VTSRTSHIAVELASDKEETNRILGNLGLPVPRQRWCSGPTTRWPPPSGSAIRSW